MNQSTKLPASAIINLISNQKETRTDINKNTPKQSPMVKVRPFKGFLANQENVGRVISPAYDTLNTQEARAMADGNEMSFLNVNKPEITMAEE